MYATNQFEIGYNFLAKHCYKKALPFLFEAAQEGHPLAHLWIEKIYSHGLDARESVIETKELPILDKALLPIS